MSKHSSDEQAVEYERPKFRAVSESELFAGYGQQPYSAGPQQNEQGYQYPNPYYYPAYGYGYGTGCWPQAASQVAEDESGSRTPLYEIRDEDDWFSLSVELPGAEPDEIDVYLGENDVVVTTDPGDDEKSEDNASRRFYGSLTLPQEIDPERTETTFANGVLHIKLPKVKPTRKHVKVGAGGKVAASSTRKNRK